MVSEDPALIRVYQNLKYEIVITCPPGETWPRLVTGADRGQARYEVVQVEIAVHAYAGDGHEPVLDTGPAFVTSGRRVRGDGRLGKQIGRRHAYTGTGREGDAVDAQALLLNAQARRAARAAYNQFITAEAKRMTARPPAR
jgi:hypothetical protein